MNYILEINIDKMRIQLYSVPPIKIYKGTNIKIKDWYMFLFVHKATKKKKLEQLTWNGAKNTKTEYIIFKCNNNQSKLGSHAMVKFYIKGDKIIDDKRSICCIYYRNIDPYSLVI